MYYFSGTVPAGGTLDCITYASVSNTAYMFDGMFSGTTPGANTEYGIYHNAFTAKNNAGTLVTSGNMYLDKKESGAPFGGKLTPSIVLSGTNIIYRISNSAAFAIDVGGKVSVIMSA